MDVFNISTGEYRQSVHTPDFPGDDGWLKVTDSDLPAGADGWHQVVWDDSLPGLRVKTAAELGPTWEQLRAERTLRLRACDWTQLPDVPLTTEQRDAWQVYRQALRDIPETFATPVEVVWPVAPAE